MTELEATRRALAALEVYGTLEDTGGCTALHLVSVHGTGALGTVVDLLWAGRCEGRMLPARVGWGYVATTPPVEGRRRGMRDGVVWPPAGERKKGHARVV